MYAIYGNMYHQYTPNVSIYTIHGSYGYFHPFENGYFDCLGRVDSGCTPGLPEGGHGKALRTVGGSTVSPTTKIFSREPRGGFEGNGPSSSMTNHIGVSKISA